MAARQPGGRQPRPHPRSPNLATTVADTPKAPCVKNAPLR